VSNPRGLRVWRLPRCTSENGKFYGIVPMRICIQWNANSGREQSASLTRIAESAGARVVVQKEPGYGRAQTSVKEAIAD